MGNRVIKAKELKIKHRRMRQQGKFTMNEIKKDRWSTNGKQFINTGRVPVASVMQEYKSHTGNTLFRTRTGEIFVARDPMELYFVSKFAKKYTDAEIIALGKPNAEGWKTAESTPLGAVKEKLLRLDADKGIMKWNHFRIRREDHIHIDLFFSPTKDRWLYIQVNPKTGVAHRSVIYGSKEVAEFKRKKKIVTWIPLSDPKQPIRI